MYKLDVPLEAQAKNSTCWHASSMMIWRYWQNQSGRQGPMWSLGEKWAKNEAIYPKEFIRLAERVGLFNLHKIGNNYNVALLEVMIRVFGPIWCAGFWYGPGHIIVLTGVDSKSVYLNDPDQGVKKTGTISWFNEKLSGDLVGSLMAKDPTAY